MKRPDRQTLRVMVQNDVIDGGYLLAAVCLYQLIDDGAEFSLTDTHIVVFSPMWCPYCTMALPDDEDEAAYLIDIITPYLI